MSIVRNTAFALVAGLAVAAPAYAQQGAWAEGPGVLLIWPNGRMVMGHVDAPAADAAMKHAKPITTPMMVFTANGKTYMVENMDEKMPDGSRMIDYFDKRTYGFF